MKCRHAGWISLDKCRECVLQFKVDELEAALRKIAETPSISWLHMRGVARAALSPHKPQEAEVYYVSRAELEAEVTRLKKQVTTLQRAGRQSIDFWKAQGAERIRTLEAALREAAGRFREADRLHNCDGCELCGILLRGEGDARRAALSPQEPTGADDCGCEECYYGLGPHHPLSPAQKPCAECDDNGWVVVPASYARHEACPSCTSEDKENKE